ncbi:MAG: HEAT repeat domain-containing protein [Thermoplasmata archaeon]|nr:MAG: HEAT repeat domain-containing protein [Thermoplasmata archaeon]
MTKVQDKAGGSQAYNNQITVQLAKFLNYIGHEDELPRKYHKIYTKEGVILKHFSKKNNFNIDLVESVVRNNLFFELDTTKVLEGFFGKQEKDEYVVHFTDLDKLKRLKQTKRKKLFSDAKTSDILLARLTNIMELTPMEGRSKESGTGMGLANYDHPRWTHEKLFSTFLPEDYDKYQDESKAQVNIEKRFHTKVPDNESFSFNNGLEANSLMSWFQSILISEPEIVREHLLNGDFEHWLRNSAKERELANICSNLARKIEDSSADAYNIKCMTVERLRRTSFEGSIYNIIVKPLIKTLKSSDAVTVQQAASKLKELGDERAVDALIDRLFDSVPATREVVMDALGKINDSRAIIPLIKVFEHSNNEYDRLNALHALGMFDDKRTRNIIKRVASSNNDEVGEEARKIVSTWPKSKKSKKATKTAKAKKKSS